MGIKQEIEQAAIAATKCPSCKAEPGQLCHYIGHGGGLCRIRKVKTHQRRLSTYVAGNIRERVNRSSTSEEGISK